jgi:hypothetical protein
LASGTYQSLQSFDNLVGCPLNGNWIIEICDAWGADDGFVFGWGMQWQGTLWGSSDFTPSIGVGCDSSYWTYANGNIISDVNNFCDTVQVQNLPVGNHLFEYHLINNHDCEYVESIQITVLENDTTFITQEFTTPITINGVTYNQSGVYYQELLNVMGCDSIIRIELMDVNTVDLLHQENQWSVFPNPAENFLLLTTGEGFVNSHYRILDANSRLCLQGTNSISGTYVDISSLQPGCYFIEIGDNGLKRDRRRFVKM